MRFYGSDMFVVILVQGVNENHITMLSNLSGKWF